MMFVCLSVFCGALVNAAVVKPISVTGTITGDVGSNINYLLDDNPGQAAASLQDEAGNPVTLVTGDTLAKALETYGFRAGGGHTESWTRGTGSGIPVFVFDLGADTEIGIAILWQYGNNGGAGEGNQGNSTREFELIFHTEAEGGSINFATEAVEFGGIMDSIPGDDTIDNFAQIYGFDSRLTARYVGLRIASNYLGQPGITAGGDRYGLGEVRFASEGYLAPEDFSKALNPEVTQTDSAAPADVDVTLSWDTGLAYDPADANEIIADPSIVKHAIFMSNGSLTDPNLYFVDEIDASGSGASYGPVTLPRSRTFYWRIDEVTDTNTIGGDVWSFVTMTADPTIVSGPADQYINAGDTGTFSVEAVNPFTDDSSGLSYEWHRVDDAGDTIVGGDSPTYTTPEQTTDNSGDGYYCVVSIVEPDVDASAVSDMAYVVVKQRIAYWPFDGTYENIDDASGLTDGVRVGDPNFAEGLVNAGKALTVDGDDYVSISNDDLAWSPTGSFSVSLWGNVNAGSAGHRAAISNRHEPPVQGFILYAQPGNTWGLWTGANVWTGPGNAPGLPGVPFVSGEWIHLVITFDPTGSSGDNLVGTSTLYVNGVKERVLEGDLYRPKALGTSPLFIGAGKNEGPTNYFFNGLIDDVRIYNHAITHEKVATLYTDVVGPACIFGNPAADVTGPEGIPDCAVDFYDFAEFALEWLDHGYFPYRPVEID